MNRPEEQAHRAIVQWLAYALPKDWLFWATPNQRGTRSVAEAQILKSLGVRPGMPDLFILGPGCRLIAIEVKAPAPTLKRGGVSQAKPRVSEEQHRVIAQLGALGVPTLIARSIDDVESALRNMGVLPQQGRGK